MKKPTSVQFKFWENLRDLTAPTEPRMSAVQTIPIPAQEQRKLSKHIKRHQTSDLLTLSVLAIALALCGGLFLAALYPHLFW